MPVKRIADMFGYFVLSCLSIMVRSSTRGKSGPSRWKDGGRGQTKALKRDRERVRGEGQGGEGATWERRWMVKTQWSVNATWEWVRVCFCLGSVCVRVCVCLQRGGRVSLKSEVSVCVCLSDTSCSIGVQEMLLIFFKAFVFKLRAKNIRFNSKIRLCASAWWEPR